MCPGHLRYIDGPSSSSHDNQNCLDIGDYPRESRNVPDGKLVQSTD